MNQDLEFKLQAFLDGELSARETAEVKDLVAHDQEAAALLGELRSVQAIMAGQETECKLPESREFFWSKIEREIERQSRAVPAETTPWFAWLRQHFLPVSGMALVACLCGVLAVHSGKGAAQFGEMELASDDMGSYTFRDQQQKMTMVWLYDRNSDAQAADSDSVGTVETE